MKLFDDPAAVENPEISAVQVWNDPNDVPAATPRVSVKQELRSVAYTFLTTMSIFAIFLIQGILVARILLPEGRGEFGTALFFPRDILMYAGLLGGIEIVNAYASRGELDSRLLKYAAARLGLLTGCLTGVVAALASCLMIWWTDSLYLLPFCLFSCLFVPLEHMQLTISAVDRGKEHYGVYNWNRLLFALAFPLLLVLFYKTPLKDQLPLSDLSIVCGLFLLSRVIGLAPTLRGLRPGKIFSSIQQLLASDPEPGADSAIEIPTAGRFLKDGRGYAVSMLATEIFERLDVLLILLFSASMVERGFYFVAVPVAAVLTVAPNALGVFTFNAGADQSRKVTLKTALAVMSAVAIFQVVACTVYAWVMPWLVINLYKPDFANSVPYALWLLPACAIKGFLQAADGYLKGRGRPLVGVWARALGVLAMLSFIAIAFRTFEGSESERLLLVPMSACVGQALCMVIISTAVIFDVSGRQHPPLARQEKPL